MAVKKEKKVSPLDEVIATLNHIDELVTNLVMDCDDLCEGPLPDVTKIEELEDAVRAARRSIREQATRRKR